MCSSDLSSFTLLRQCQTAKCNMTVATCLMAGIGAPCYPPVLRSPNCRTITVPCKWPGNCTGTGISYFGGSDPLRNDTIATSSFPVIFLQITPARCCWGSSVITNGGDVAELLLVPPTCSSRACPQLSPQLAPSLWRRGGQGWR